MIHAAITAVALSCCTTITIAGNTERPNEGTSIDFKGGSVAEYIQQVTDGFQSDDQDPNIVLLPGTEGVSLPAISIRVTAPADAFAAISDFIYTGRDGKRISVDFETIGGDTTIYRISGREWVPGNRSPTNSRAASPRTFAEDMTVTIMRVPGSKIPSVIDIATKAIELAGLSERTNMVPLVEDDLLLVSSTRIGIDLVGEVVFEILRPDRKNDEKKRSRGEVPVETQDRDSIRSEISRLAKLKKDASSKPGSRKAIDERLRSTLKRLRDTN